MRRFKATIGGVQLPLVELSEPIVSICGNREIGAGEHLIQTEKFTEALELCQEFFNVEMNYEIGLASFFDGESIGFDLMDLRDVLSALKDESPIAYGIERALMLLALRSIGFGSTEN